MRWKNEPVTRPLRESDGKGVGEKAKGSSRPGATLRRVERAIGGKARLAMAEGHAALGEAYAEQPCHRSGAARRVDRRRCPAL
jgi:hypothetical protein